MIKKHRIMKTLTVTRDKSFVWSIGIHLGILLMGLIPLAQKMAAPPEVEYLIEVGWEELPEIKQSGSEGLQALSPVYNEEPEPTTPEPAKEPVPVDDPEPVEEIEIAEDVSEIESDVTMESETDVVASGSSDNGADAETHADGGGSGSPLEGNQDGGAMAGDGGAGDGLEGDGIITRRVIYRENISKVAKENGRIVLNICINRQGMVESVAFDQAKTTITDKKIIKEASEIAARYRFEAKYNAPKKECGQLTFIFNIEEPIDPVWKLFMF
jgi:hypothetical protein